jgi:uncharacterized lipoprotein YmbA
MPTLGMLLAVCGSIAGCSSGLPPTHYYVLRPPQEAAAEGVLTTVEEGLSVGVEAFSVDPPYDQDRIVHRRGRDSPEVGFHAYDRWAAPLGRLVSVAFAEGLRGTTGISSIEPARSTSHYAARLRGRVIRFEELDSEDGQNAEAWVALALTLVDRDGRTLWTRTVNGSASGEAASASDVVVLLRQAFDSALEEVRHELGAALKSQQPNR